MTHNTHTYVQYILIVPDVIVCVCLRIECYVEKTGRTGEKYSEKKSFSYYCLPIYL